MTLRNIAASMQHRRPRRAALAAANVIACSTLIGFIACSDGDVTEPAAAKASTAVSATAPSPGSAPRADVALATTAWSKDFTYVARTGTTVTFPGGAKVILPPHAVCAPNSGYGPSVWDKPCTAIPDSIHFHVVAGVMPNGAPGANVTPDVRFVPGAAAHLYLPAMAGSTGQSAYIAWCPTGALQCVDESVTDTSMVTAYDGVNGVAHRRIKHFSGYYVQWGKSASSAAPTTQNSQGQNSQ